MNRRGFTLVEMIAVITLIALISTFTLPPIINQINKKKSDMKHALEETVYAASNIYVRNNKSTYNKKNYTYCLTFDKLVNDNYLDKNILSDNTLNGHTVKIIYKDDYSYSIVDSCT